MKMFRLHYLILPCCYIFFILTPDFANADVHIADWDHDHHHTHPDNWEGMCKEGQRQSPIDIVTNETTKEKWGQPFIFHGYERRLSMNVKNNRHSMVAEFENDKKYEDIWIRGGGLGESKFRFAQLHFHWGSTNDQGSEHTIDGKAAPMEMHIVHWNLDVGKDVKEATQKDAYNSLEVLGVLFKLGKFNKDYDAIFNAARKVEKENTNATLEKDVRLRDLLPEDTNAFYRYIGSLTTPPCNQIVMWTIFKDPIEISQEQLDIMRKGSYRLEGENDVRYIANNYRSTQNLYEREVLDIDTHIVHLACNSKGSTRYHYEEGSEGFVHSKGNSLNSPIGTYIFFYLSIVVSVLQGNGI